jgi:hypothetical protein
MHAPPAHAHLVDQDEIANDVYLINSFILIILFVVSRQDFVCAAYVPSVITYLPHIFIVKKAKLSFVSSILGVQKVEDFGFGEFFGDFDLLFV